MKISLNDEELFTLSDIQKKVLQNDIFIDIFENDMKRRLKYIIEHPVNRFVEQNAHSAREFLKTRNVSSIPSDKMEFAKLVFEHAPVALSDVEIEKYVVRVDNQEFFEISDITKKILKSCVSKNCCCVEWSKKELKLVLIHKYERCMERLRREWEPKLIDRGIKSFPIDDDEFAKLVFSQEDYLNRTDREIKNKEA